MHSTSLVLFLHLFASILGLAAGAGCAGVKPGATRPALAVAQRRLRSAAHRRPDGPRPSTPPRRRITLMMGRAAPSRPQTVGPHGDGHRQRRPAGRDRHGAVGRATCRAPRLERDGDGQRAGHLHDHRAQRQHRQATATITATFNGDVVRRRLPDHRQGTLDDTTSGTAQLAYPLDHALFPSNLSPIYAHIAMAGMYARLHFSRATGSTSTSTATARPGCRGRAAT